MGTMIFENDTCSRCGGTGEFSYNQKDGTTCYGCGGRGETLTKKGKAAQVFFHDSMEVKIEDMKVGNFMKHGSRWQKITDIKKDDKRINFTFKNGCGLNTHLTGYSYPCVESDEEWQELKIKALEYQSKLTKAGKLMKKFK